MFTIVLIYVYFIQIKIMFVNKNSHSFFLYPNNLNTRNMCKLFIKNYIFKLKRKNLLFKQVYAAHL